MKVFVHKYCFKYMFLIASVELSVWESFVKL